MKSCMEYIQDGMKMDKNQRKWTLEMEMEDLFIEKHGPKKEYYLIHMEILKNNEDFN